MSKTIKMLRCVLALCLIAAALPLAAEEAMEELGLDTATHVEADPIDVEFERLTNLCMTPDGKLLATDGEAKVIKVIGLSGKLESEIELKFGPESIATDAQGVVYCGGEGQLAKLTTDGKILATTKIPEEAIVAPSESRRSWNKPQMVSGVAINGDDVFVAFGSGWSMGSKSKLFRFDADLQNPKQLAEGLRGCCQRCDLTVKDGVLYLAENSVHRVVAMDRDGEVLGKWGFRSRTDLEGFGSCCNPMNIYPGKGDVIYTSESGLGRVKAYTTKGEYLGLVGYIGVERFTNAGHLAASCSNIAIAVTPDEKTAYVMDFTANIIRVLKKKD